MKIVFQELLRWWFLSLIVIFFIVLGVYFDLIIPYFSKFIIDDGIVAGNLDVIWQYGGWMLGASILVIISSILSHYFDAILSARVARDLREQVFRNVETFSVKEFDEMSASSLITRSTNDVGQVQRFLMMSLRMLVRAPLMALGGIAITLTFEPELSIIILVGVIILAIFVVVVSLWMTPISVTLQKKMDRVNQILREKLTGIRVIRAFNKVDYEQQRFDSANDDLRKVNTLLQRISALTHPGFSIIINFTTATLIYVSVSAIGQSADMLQIGSLSTTISMVMMILSAILMVSMVIMNLPRAMASSRRISEVLNTHTSIHEVNDDSHFTLKTPVIEFDHVTFYYPKAESPTIDNISFQCEAGKTTAIIGSTGSGKTTLAKLLLRFYEAKSGSIRISQTDIKEIKLTTLHEMIGYVPQKASLFSGTISSNVTYGADNLSEIDIWEVLKVAQIKDHVDAQPQGLNSDISQAAVNLSGGQKQRLAIARALAKKPSIYLFDDSFSAVDFRTDVALREALHKYANKATVLIIAQRINTIRHADQIIVLEEGKLVGKGTHEELLVHNKTYQEIVYSQLSKEEATHE